MASIGHVAVGVAAGSPRLKDAVILSALALLPDTDVIGFAFGIPYASQWGHRGFTHSIFTALVVALLISRKRFPLYALVLVSHGLLDALTTGGLGPALLWPFDHTRYFFSWRPIPVAPIGVPSVRFLLHEALLMLPLWLIALGRLVAARRRA